MLEVQQHGHAHLLGQFVDAVHFRRIDGHLIFHFAEADGAAAEIVTKHIDRPRQRCVTRRKPQEPAAILVLDLRAVPIPADHQIPVGHGARSAALEDPSFDGKQNSDRHAVHALVGQELGVRAAGVQGMLMNVEQRLIGLGTEDERRRQAGERPCYPRAP